MGLENLKAGENLPEDFNVVIEIPTGSTPIKYEVDKQSGMVMVDRFLGTAMSYPCEYGFIPHTLSEDGDPVDVLVVSPYSLIPGTVIRCRPIGMLKMTDESGRDTKVLAVPVNKITKKYQNVSKSVDLGQDFLDRVEHFFTHYKDLEPEKWVKIEGWADKDAAKQEIVNSVNRYSEQENQ